MRFKGNHLLHFVPDFTVIDIETTGRGNQYSEITEVSAIKYRKYKPIKKYSTLVKARNSILPFVEKLTGISDDMLLSEPDISQVIEPFVSFIGDDIIVGHNVNFDLNLVYDAYYDIHKRIVSNDYLDTLNLSRILNEDSYNHKLETLCAYYDIKRDQGHRALADAKQTGELYVKMKEKATKTRLLHVKEG